MNRALIISLVHIFITGAFLFFIGWVNFKLPIWVFWLTLALGIAVAIAWAFKFSWTFMPILHIFIIAPVLIAIGILKKNSPFWLFQVSIIIGAGAIGYHAMKIIKSL